MDLLSLLFRFFDVNSFHLSILNVNFTCEYWNLIENITNVENSNYDFDDIWFGLYDIVFAFDHELKKTYLFSVNLDDYQEGTNNLSNIKKLEDYKGGINDLIYNLYLNLDEVQQDKFMIPHPDGLLNMGASKTFDTSKPLRLRGKGYPGGDMYVKLHVKFERTT